MLNCRAFLGKPTNAEPGRCYARAEFVWPLLHRAIIVQVQSRMCIRIERNIGGETESRVQMLETSMKLLNLEGERFDQVSHKTWRKRAVNALGRHARITTDLSSMSDHSDGLLSKLGLRTSTDVSRVSRR
jgi:hypothetical protein